MTNAGDTYQFHNHEGRELTAHLDGAAGDRTVQFFDSRLQFIGSRRYAELMAEDCSEMFAPRGDVQGARDEDLILIDAGRLRAVAEWAEGVVLGLAAIGEEA